MKTKVRLSHTVQKPRLLTILNYWFNVIISNRKLEWAAVKVGSVGFEKNDGWQVSDYKD